MANDPGGGVVEDRSPAAPGSGATGLLAAHAQLSGDGTKRGQGQAGKKRGPYKGRAEGDKPAGPSSPTAAPAAPPLFTVENTAELVRIPFLLAAVKTDCPHLELDEKEALRLAIPGSVALNYWWSVSPKWTSLGLLGVAALGVVSHKFAVYTAWARAVAEREAGQVRGPAPGAQPGAATGAGTDGGRPPAFGRT